MSAMGRPSRRGSERLGGELHDVVTLFLRGDIPLEELRRDLRGAAHPRAVRPYGDGRDTGIGATWGLETGAAAPQREGMARGAAASRHGTPGARVLRFHPCPTPGGSTCHAQRMAETKA